jgi:hypothetical protein
VAFAAFRAAARNLWPFSLSVLPEPAVFRWVSRGKPAQFVVAATKASTQPQYQPRTLSGAMDVHAASIVAIRMMDGVEPVISGQWSVIGVMDGAEPQPPQTFKPADSLARVRGIGDTTTFRVGDGSGGLTQRGRRKAESRKRKAEGRKAELRVPNGEWRSRIDQTPSRLGDFQAVFLGRFDPQGGATRCWFRGIDYHSGNVMVLAWQASC